MSAFRLSLKANEKLYLNGAVVRFDRKTSIEIMNDVNFLLESHVLQASEATTPLKQLYFVVQMMLMTPQDTQKAQAIYDEQMPSLLSTFRDPQIVSELKSIDAMVRKADFFGGMRALRDLFGRETAILAGTEPACETQKARA